VFFILEPWFCHCCKVNWNLVFGWCVSAYEWKIVYFYLKECMILPVNSFVERCISIWLLAMYISYCNQYIKNAFIVLKTSQKFLLQHMTLHRNLVQTLGWSIYVSMNQALVLNNTKWNINLCQAIVKLLIHCYFTINQ